MRDLSIKSSATNLRKGGYSYTYISKKTGISKSTLSGWLQSIPYSPNDFTVETIGKARAKSGEAKSKIKKQSYDRAAYSAKNDIGTLTKRDIFMLGIGMYIGEGSKTNDIVRIVNSDPAIIRFAVRWFVDVCGLTADNLVARIHLYPSNDELDAIEYWHAVSGISKHNFQKSSVDTRKNKKSIKAGTTPHGTLHVSVRSRGVKEFGVALSRRIAGWMALVLEYDRKKQD